MQNFEKCFLEWEKVASKKFFQHFLHANVFMFILSMSNYMIFLVQFCINLHLQVFKKGVIALADSAYEVKNNSCLFERLSKVKENGVFLFAISFFILEIFTFLYYANEGNDDVIDRSTKTVQHSIKNISGNIKAVFLRLGTRNVHHKGNKMRAVMLLPWQQLCHWPCFNYN